VNPQIAFAEWAPKLPHELKRSRQPQSNVHLAVIEARADREHQIAVFAFQHLDGGVSTGATDVRVVFQCFGKLEVVERVGGGESRRLRRSPPDACWRTEEAARATGGATVHAGGGPAPATPSVSTVGETDPALQSLSRRA
jgi:hypothetical protein